MLGEKHSLLNDFPEMGEIVAALIENDQAFAEMNVRYTVLDDKIRKLELRDAPIADDAMHAMKHERAELKDRLYQSLLAARD